MLHRRSTLLLVVSIVACFLFVACNRKGGETNKGTKEAVQVTADELASTLVSRIPKDSFGFALVDTHHPAFEKLEASQWGSGEQVLSNIEPQDAEAKKIMAAVSRAGLDLRDKEVRKKAFGQIVLFLAPSMRAEQSGFPARFPEFGLLFKSQMNLSEKTAQLKAELVKEGLALRDISVPEGVGFVFSEKPDQKWPERVVFAATEELGIFCSNEQLALSVLDNKSEELPAIVASDRYKRATTGFPSQEARFSIGYFDLDRLVNAENDGLGNEQFKKFFTESIALDALSFSAAMEQAPVKEVRLLPTPAKGGAPTVFSSAAASTTSKILPAVYGRPLLFFSVDGSTANSIKDLLLKAEEQKTLAEDLSFLQAISRLGIVVRVAPVGQSFLPLPDVAVIADTKDSVRVAKEVEGIVNKVVQNSALPGNWTEKLLDGKTKVRSMVNPLGIGIFIAAKDNLLIVASSEIQMKNALAEQRDQKGFINDLPSLANPVFEQATVDNFYLNFEELASLLENMGGLLTMYAPQNNSSAKFLNPANIQALRKEGILVSYLVREADGMLVLKSHYQAAQKPTNK